jgi:hypothetical protein
MTRKEGARIVRARRLFILISDRAVTLTAGNGKKDSRTGEEGDFDSVRVGARESM